MSHARAVLGGSILPAGEAAACLLGSLLLGFAITAGAALLRPWWRRAARQLALVLLVPGIVLAPRPALSAAPGPGAGPRAAFLVLGALPLLVLPALSRLAGMLDGQVRAASGLGAGRIAILRLVWLPQMGPPGLLGALLAGLLDLAALALRR